MKYLLLVLFVLMVMPNAQSKDRLQFLVQYKADPIKNLVLPEKMSLFLQQTTEKNSFFVLQKYLDKASFASVKNLWIVESSMARLSASELFALKNDQRVRQIIPLGRVASLTEGGIIINPPDRKFTYGLRQIKSDQLVVSRPDLTGYGVKVGIIDTGIDPLHLALSGRLIKYKDFTDLKNQNPRDDHGHGTHVAGTIAGNADSGEAIGVAPEAKLIIAKAFTSSGSSTDENLLLSLQWMADPDQDPNTLDFPRVISNSWNIGAKNLSNMNPDQEPFCLAIQNLRRIGISVLFAAGNDGSSSGTVKIPGACPEALTVGATNESDAIASFSSRGPVKWKDVTLIKPDISAPGENVNSANPGGGYKKRSGTSMATPHAAGSMALIYQDQPNLSVIEAEKMLLLNSDDKGSVGHDNIFGFGRINLINTFK